MGDGLSIFGSPDRHQVVRRADELVHRANLVRRVGWDEYRDIWSCGEVIGTALVLGDDAELRRCGETTISALERWAFDLWGVIGGQSDVDAGLARTRAWFDSIRVAR